MKKEELLRIVILILLVIIVTIGYGGSCGKKSDSETGSSADNPPVLISPGDKTIDEGQLLTFTLSAADSDSLACKKVHDSIRLDASFTRCNHEGIGHPDTYFPACASHAYQEKPSVDTNYRI